MSLLSRDQDVIICIAGKNTIATECLSWLRTEQKWPLSRLVACPVQGDQGHDSHQRSFKKLCLTLGIRIVAPNEIEDIEELTFFSLEYDRLIKPSRFRSSNLFNIHFSLLPKYRGMYTSAWPLLNGEVESGVTLHKIDHGIDTGPIVDQISFRIEDGDSCRDLYFKHTAFGISIFKKNFDRVLRNDYSLRPQEILGASYYSRSSIDYKNLVINLQKSAVEVRNQVRGYCYPEYQYPVVHGYRISSAEILDCRSTKSPGSLVHNEMKNIVVATIDYDVRLTKALYPEEAK